GARAPRRDVAVPELGDGRDGREEVGLEPAGVERAARVGERAIEQDVGRRDLIVAQVEAGERADRELVLGPGLARAEQRGLGLLGVPGGLVDLRELRGAAALLLRRRRGLDEDVLLLEGTGAVAPALVERDEALA